MIWKGIYPEVGTYETRFALFRVLLDDGMVVWLQRYEELVMRNSIAPRHPDEDDPCAGKPWRRVFESHPRGVGNCCRSARWRERRGEEKRESSL